MVKWDIEKKNVDQLKRAIFILFFLCLWIRLEAGEKIANPESIQLASNLSETIIIDCNSDLGEIKPLYQGLCQEHILDTGLTGADQTAIDLIKQIDVGIIRLCLHTENIFPISGNPMADPTDPEEYNFDQLDQAVLTVKNFGAEPLINVCYTPPAISSGEGIWGWTYPPRDFNQYAQMIKHIVKHLNQNWKDGHNWNIKYWEIWNEPDLPIGTFPDGGNFWHGTKEEYFLLFSKCARAIKEVDSSLLVGGPSSASPDSPWIPDFINYCTINDVPFDIIFFHYYCDDPDLFGLAVDYIRGLLNGRPVCLWLSEWNLYADYGDPRHDTIEAAVHNSSVLMKLTEHDCDFTTRFRAQDSPEIVLGKRDNFGLLTRNPTISKPVYHAYQAFKIMNETPIRIVNQENIDNLEVLAGKSDDKITLIICNRNNQELFLDIEIKNIPYEMNYFIYQQHLLTQDIYYSGIGWELMESTVGSGNYFARAAPSPAMSLIVISLYIETFNAETLILMAHYLADNISFNQFPVLNAADFDGDGKITVLDLLLLRYFLAAN